MNKKYFFCDLDGTLLHQTEGHFIPHAANIAAIQQFVKDGNVFVIATGRGYRDVLQISENLGIPVTYAIVQNGAFIYHNHQPIYKRALEPTDVKTIMQFMQKRNRPRLLELLSVESGAVYLNTKGFFGYLYSQRLKKHDAGKYHRWTKQSVADITAQQLGLAKIVVLTRRTQHLQVIERDIRQAFEDSYSIACSSSYALEICAPGVDKGKAIKHLMDAHNILQEDIGFVGDSGNDVSALQLVDHAYIMDHTDDKYKVHRATEVADVSEALALFMAKG